MIDNFLPGIRGTQTDRTGKSTDAGAVFPEDKAQVATSYFQEKLSGRHSLDNVEDITGGGLKIKTLCSKAKKLALSH
ncbi:MAG: hypothetical protein ACK5M7_05970 [Draconibacterium sp.]